jgi:hypothetical protein
MMNVENTDAAHLAAPEASLELRIIELSKRTAGLLRRHSNPIETVTALSVAKI